MKRFGPVKYFPPKPTDSILYVNFINLDDAISAVRRSVPAPLGADGFTTVGKRADKIKLKATFDYRYCERIRFKFD